MSIVTEPIPVVPDPVPNKVIEAYQRGSYDPYVKDGNGNPRNVVEFCSELFANMDSSGSVLARFNVQNGYLTPSVGTLADNLWTYEDSPYLTVLQSMAIPSISDLGIDIEKYQVYAKTMFTCRDSLNTESEVETRLIDLNTGLEVSGSRASKTLTEGSTEQLIESDWFEVPTNGNFFLDFRTPVNTSANGAQARRQAILVRVVRR